MKMGRVLFSTVFISRLHGNGHHGVGPGIVHKSSLQSMRGADADVASSNMSLVVHPGSGMKNGQGITMVDIP